MHVSYENGIIKTPDFPIGNHQSGGIGYMLFEKMKEHPERTAQIEARSGKSDTFKQLLQKSVRTAIALRELGIKKGDFVALCSNHHLNACVPILSSYFLGAVPICLEPAQTIEEYAHLLKQIHPKILFVIRDAKAKIEQALNETGTSEIPIITFEDEYITKFLSNQNDEDSFTPEYVSDLKEIAAIYFSSGSSGLPKGICISNEFLGSWCNPRMRNYEEENPVYFNPANWYWVSAGITLVAYTYLGGCRLLVSSYKAEEIWEWIDKYKITKMFLYLFNCIELTSKPKPPNLDYSSLRTIYAGGSRVPAEYAEKMWKLLPGVSFLQGYGMTELVSVTGFDKASEKYAKIKIESIGHPLPGNWYKVVDPETEKILGPNQPGELRLKSKRLMSGYYNRDTSEVFDEDGWFKTGDLVYYDEEFFFFCVGRLKESISYRSQWVYPAQIEKVLMQHPVVKLAVVVGVPHPIDEELPTAVVVLNEGSNRNGLDKELEQFVNEKVVDRNKLRGGVIFVKEFPMTTTGKVNRVKLRQMIVDKIIE